MSFTKLRSTQNQFLETYLRGTTRELSSAQARETFGVKNLRARVTELRQAGLNIRKNVNTKGRTTYAVSRRDVFGNQFMIFN